MRIAFIALHFAEYSVQLAAELAVQNDVLLILYADNARNELGGRLTKEFSRPRLKVLLIERPANALQVLRNANTLVRAVRGFDPNVLHMQEDLRDELVLALLFFGCYPRLMTVHDPVTHSGVDSKRMRFSRYRLYRALVRRTVDRVFVHGAALEAAMLQELPRLKGRIHSVPHGPLGPTGELPAISPATPASFLFFGRLHEYKGLRYFIEAIQRLHQSGCPVRGVIAGRGTDLAPNRSLIDKTPAAFEVIERYISDEEVETLFSSTTAAVLPYIDGTQSGVAAMALGYGRPVIATRVGSIPELVRDGVNGILIPPKDVDALTVAMRALAENHGQWLELAKGALELRSGELSWKQIVATTCSAYLAALHDRKCLPI